MRLYNLRPSPGNSLGEEDFLPLENNVGNPGHNLLFLAIKQDRGTEPMNLLLCMFAAELPPDWALEIAKRPYYSRRKAEIAKDRFSR